MYMYICICMYIYTHTGKATSLMGSNLTTPWNKADRTAPSNPNLDQSGGAESLQVNS